MKDDKSFQEKEHPLSLLFGRKRYTQENMRQTWEQGIKHGIEIWLRKASLEGQRIELYNNTTSEKHKEFLEKFYQLADEYKCAIHYHPKVGMVVVAR